MVYEDLKIALVLFKGNRKDFPWLESNVIPAARNVASTSDYVMLAHAVLRDHIEFSLKQIVKAKELIIHYEFEVAQYRLLWDIGVHSGQTKEI